MAIAYSASLPILEGQDEHEHVGVVEYVATRRALPPLGPDTPTHAYQPPLYYILGALVAAPAPRVVALPRNPYFAYDLWRPSADNKNLFVHTRAESFPYRGTALTVHLLRLVSAAMGTATVLVTFAVARAVFPERPRLCLASAAIVACLPAFLAVSASVSNDALAALLGAVLIYFAVLAVKSGGAWKPTVAMGAVIGLVWLTKLTASFLVLPAWLAVAATGGRGTGVWRRLTLVAGRSALLAGTALTISGAWLVRNYRLYGEVTGVAALNERLGMVGWWWQGWGWLAGVAEGVNRDFWIRFGWGNVSAPAPVYAGLALAAALSAVGLARWAVARGWRRDGLSPLVTLVIASAAMLAVAAAFAYPFINRHGVQGRLFLFPALPAIAILLTLGWREMLPVRWVRREMFTIFPVGLIALAAYGWLGVLRSAYARPPLLRDDQLPPGLTPIGARFGDLAELVGAAVPAGRVCPGDHVTVTLCWRALEATTRNVSEFVHVVRADTAKFGQRETYPGLGRFPTSDWRPDDLFCDAIPVHLSPHAPAPGVYSVVAGMFGEPDEPAAGTLTVGRLVIGPPSRPDLSAATSAQARFGDAIDLMGYESSLDELKLYWQAVTAPGEDWVLFVHWLDASGQPLVLSDAQPMAGEFPTSVWSTGDWVTETRQFTLPIAHLPGPSGWEVGWYRPSTGERLPAVGNAVGDGAVMLPGPVLP